MYQTKSAQNQVWFGGGGRVEFLKYNEILEIRKKSQVATSKQRSEETAQLKNLNKIGENPVRIEPRTLPFRASQACVSWEILRSFVPAPVGFWT